MMLQGKAKVIWPIEQGDVGACLSNRLRPRAQGGCAVIASEASRIDDVPHGGSAPRDKKADPA